MDVRSFRVRMKVTVLLALALLLSAAPLAVAAPGDLDPSFSGDGKVTTDFGGLDEAHAVLLDTEGRIVVAGGKDEFALARYLSDGSLDPTFGVDGKVTTPVGGGGLAFAAALDAQDRIVVAGRASSSGGYGYDFALARYLEDGTLDPSFGAGGKVFTDFGGVYDFALAVALDGAGRIVAAGRASPRGDYDFALARYLEDGALDPTFGADGKVTTDIRGDVQEDTAHAVAVDTLGRIVAAGYTSTGGQAFAIARYLEDGALDASFGASGMVTGPAGYGMAAALDTTGRILVAGMAQGNFAVARYLVDGTLDSSFGAAGSATTDFGGFDWGYALVLDSAGRIVVVGDTGTGGDFALTRYLSDGTTDLTFGANGKVTTDFGGDDTAYAVALDAKGRIVAAGDTWAFPGWDFALARYLGDDLAPTYLPLIRR